MDGLIGLTPGQIKALQRAYQAHREQRPGSRLPTRELLAALREGLEKIEAGPGDTLSRFKARSKLERETVPNPLKPGQDSKTSV